MSRATFSRIAMAFGVLALLAGGVARAAEPVSAPYEMMRALSVLQDQIAAGNAMAQIGQVKMIGRMAERFSTVDPSVWKDKRNARALILYLFDGGNAAALDGFIDKDQVAKGYEALFEGAMAYASGDDGKARALLLPVDARNIPSGLGGHLALVQATLVANADRPRAVQLLDLARLLDPGTLVEEAALRKEIFLIGATGDLEKSALLARRYMRAFSKSIYAENFRQLEIKTAIEIGHADNAESSSRMEGFLAGIDRRERRVILLTVAKAALIEGRLTTARYTAAAAARLSDKPDGEEARATVYLGAASIATEDYEASLHALRGVDPGRLGSRDADLRASALEMAAMIRAQDSSLDAGAGGDGKAEPAAFKRTLGEAEQALAASDALLQRSTP